MPSGLTNWNEIVELLSFGVTRQYTVHSRPGAA
jgi:hypothetical protein